MLLHRLSRRKSRYHRVQTHAQLAVFRWPHPRFSTSRHRWLTYTHRLRCSRYPPRTHIPQQSTRRIFEGQADQRHHALMSNNVSIFHAHRHTLEPTRLHHTPPPQTQSFQTRPRRPPTRRRYTRARRTRLRRSRIRSPDPSAQIHHPRHRH